MESPGLHFDFYFFQYEGEHHIYLLMIGGVLVLNGMEFPSAISSCTLFVAILILYLSYSPPLAPPSVPNVHSAFHYVTALSGKRTPALSLSSESSRKDSVGPPLRKYPTQDNLAL